MREQPEGNEFTLRLRNAIVMLDAERRERVRLEIENASLRDALAEKTRVLELSEKRLAESQESLHHAEEELSEHKSVDEKLAEFDRELTKFEELKQDYERRIAQLKSRLHSAEQRLKSLKITLSERDLSDLEEVERPVRTPQARQYREEDPVDSSDWLMELPDF